MKRLAMAILLLAHWATAAQAVSLYALSGDDIGVPRRVNHIDTDTNVVTPVFDLGSGALGFNGLTFFDDRFYTIGNDMFGNSSLHSFSLTDGGATSSVFSLGVGFNGGLVATASDQLFALRNPGSPFGGPTELYSIDPTTSSAALIGPALPFGAARGLTWDPGAQLLYALGSDIFFRQSIFSIDPAPPGVVLDLTGLLGLGVTGGVDVQPGGDFFAVSNVTGASTLVTVTPGGTVTPELALAPFPSFDFAGLTSGPAFVPPPPTPTPSPATLWLLAPAAWLLARRRRPAGPV